MNHLRYLLKGGLLALVVLTGASAYGIELAQAKADGLIGERADGYIGLVKSDAAADVVELVKQINGKRRAEYRRIAEANDLSVEEVQALAGKKAIDRTGPGNWILTNGGWRQK